MCLAEWGTNNFDWIIDIVRLEFRAQFVGWKAVNRVSLFNDIPMREKKKRKTIQNFWPHRWNHFAFVIHSQCSFFLLLRFSFTLFEKYVRAFFRFNLCKWAHLRWRLYVCYVLMFIYSFSFSFTDCYIWCTVNIASCGMQMCKLWKLLDRCLFFVCKFITTTIGHHYIICSPCIYTYWTTVYGDRRKLTLLSTTSPLNKTIALMSILSTVHTYIHAPSPWWYE